MTTFAAPIAEQIWDMKYRFKRDGAPVDATVEESWGRVAKALAAADRSACGPVCPPQGLYLTGVGYPKEPFAGD